MKTISDLVFYQHRVVLLFAAFFMAGVTLNAGVAQGIFFFKNNAANTQQIIVHLQNITRDKSMAYERSVTVPVDDNAAIFIPGGLRIKLIRIKLDYVMLDGSKKSYYFLLPFYAPSKFGEQTAHVISIGNYGLCEINGTIYRAKNWNLSFNNSLLLN